MPEIGTSGLVRMGNGAAKCQYPRLRTEQAQSCSGWFAAFEMHRKRRDCFWTLAREKLLCGTCELREPKTERRDAAAYCFGAVETEPISRVSLVTQLICRSYPFGVEV